MKTTIHIPTVQYGFIELEGDISDLEQMIDIHNKYSYQKIEEPKTRKPNQPNPYKGIADNFDLKESLK